MSARRGAARRREAHLLPPLCTRCPPSQVLGEVGALPDVFTELEINFFLLRRLLGVRTSGDEKQGKVGDACVGLVTEQGDGLA